MNVNELFPGSLVKDLVTPGRPGWSTFNPSIARSPHGYACIIRSSNYTMDLIGRYLINDPETAIRTVSYIADLDEDLRVIDMTPIDDSIIGSEDVLFPLVVGMEDARLYWHPSGCWHAYGTVRYQREDGLCQIAEDVLDENYRVTSRVIYPEIVPGRHEKNWVKLGNGPEFVYQYNPPHVIDPEGNTLTAVDCHYFDIPRTLLRGSSQAIPLGDGYIAVTHEVTWATGSRRYFSRFVKLNRQGYLTNWTDRFHFVSEGIEFVAGITEWNECYAVSFGYQDVRAMLAVVPKALVIDALGGLVSNQD